MGTLTRGTLLSCALAVALLMALCIAGCGGGRSYTKVVTDADCVPVEKDEGDDISVEIRDMGADEALATVDEDLGIALSGYAEDAYGFRRQYFDGSGNSHGSSFFIELTIREESEDEVEQVITARFGESGIPARELVLRLADGDARASCDLNEAELLTWHSYLRTPKKGKVQTADTEIYSAVLDGRRVLFVCGS